MTRAADRPRFAMEDEKPADRFATLIVVVVLATLLYGLVMFYFEGVGLGS